MWYKKAGVHILKSSLPIHQKCDHQKFDWRKKKKPIDDTNGQLPPLPTNHSWQWKEEETHKTLPAMLEEKNKKKSQYVSGY